MSQFKLLCVSHDAKTIKGQKKGYLTGILYLAPHKLSGRNVCSHASPECIALCLNLAGRGRMSPVQQSRIRKTRWFTENQEEFLLALVADIRALIRLANRMGLIPCVRLNGTSDLPWESIRVGSRSMMELFRQEIQFYDYTKIPLRMKRFMDGGMAGNYHLTFSRSEVNADACSKVMGRGFNVSVVFRGALPETWGGVPVFKGDDSDLRFLDPAGVVVGLTAKGPAKRSTSGGFAVLACNS